MFLLYDVFCNKEFYWSYWPGPRAEKNRPNSGLLLAVCFRLCCEAKMSTPLEDMFIRLSNGAYFDRKRFAEDIALFKVWIVVLV